MAEYKDVNSASQISSMTREQKFILAAIELSRKGMMNNDGGPFGCIVVKGEEIVGRGNNRVTSTNDPTAHAEVVAIRDACRNLQTFQLDDCEIYTSCEPCPMCMGAIYWARPKKVYYANTRVDAANIGFDDSLIYDELVLPIDKRKIAIECIGREEAIKVFEDWNNKTDKVEY
jgi:guanine deaminase